LPVVIFSCPPAPTSGFTRMAIEGFAFRLAAIRDSVSNSAMLSTLI
jgi:hypothetical protein